MSYIAGLNRNFKFEILAMLFRRQIQNNEERTMIMLFLLFVALLILGIAACRQGANSSDGIESPEWKRRQDWSGFH